MRDLADIIQSRRSVRKFLETPVPWEELKQIVEAGRWAPTGGNCQSVHFLVITREAVLENLRTRVREAFAKMEITEEQYISVKRSIHNSKNGNYIYDYGAKALVIVANQKSYPNAMADSSCAMQNMMLMAERLGLGSCWVNQLHWLDENEHVREYLSSIGLGDEETICGALAIGCYEKDIPVKERIGMLVDYIV